MHSVTVETYKQAKKHILFGVVNGSFSFTVLIVLLGYQRKVGVLNMVVIKATVQTGGGLVAVKTMFQVTRMAVKRTKTRRCKSVSSCLSVTAVYRDETLQKAGEKTYDLKFWSATVSFYFGIFIL